MPSAASRTLHYPYSHTVPAWRTAPGFRLTPLGTWLEQECQRRRWTMQELARRLHAYPGCDQAGYMIIYSWLHDHKLPGMTYVSALAGVFGTEVGDVLGLVAASEAERAAGVVPGFGPAAALRPAPRRLPPRGGPVAPPAQSTERLRAQAVARLLAALSTHPDLIPEEVLAPFYDAAETAAEEHPLAARVHAVAAGFRGPLEQRLAARGYPADLAARVVAAQAVPDAELPQAHAEAEASRPQGTPTPA